MTLDRWRVKEKLSIRAGAAKCGIGTSTFYRACCGWPVSRATACFIETGTGGKVRAASLVFGNRGER